MTIELNHTIVPARDKGKSARFFADIFGLKYEGSSGHFAPVRVNDRLTFDFDEDDSFEAHHYAFHVSDTEFDAICSGRYDQQVPAPLAASYFQTIRAPCKQLIWFERSAHHPPFEEAEKFNRMSWLDNLQGDHHAVEASGSDHIVHHIDRRPWFSEREEVRKDDGPSRDDGGVEETGPARRAAQVVRDIGR
ncbi:MAG TPA: hypothetical protein VFW94_00415 [Candidatus Acidoferrales bacterium]|nr:hypothetical protein [Candidatus Acidoferrales bacterium]